MGKEFEQVLHQRRHMDGKINTWEDAHIISHSGNTNLKAQDNTAHLLEWLEWKLARPSVGVDMD